MKANLVPYTCIYVSLLAIMTSLAASAQETPHKPPERSDRGSARGMDPAERLKRMLEHFDADKDGVLTKEEFKGDQERFKRMDANGDGKVDARVGARAAHARTAGTAGTGACMACCHRPRGWSPNFFPS